MNDFSYYSRVAILHMDGANTSTTITDNENTPKVWTCNGSAQLSTAQYVFGTASALFNGTTSYISTPNHADFNFGTGDFCIQCRVRFASTADQTLISNYQDASNGFSLGLTSSKLTFNATGGGIDSQGITTLSTNAWNDIEMSRTAGVAYLFLNGAVETSGANVQNITSTAILALGRLGSSASIYLNGYLDEVRISKGVGGHTTNYTPEIQAFPDAVEIALAEFAIALPALTFVSYGASLLDVSLPALAFEAYSGPSLDASLPALSFTGSFGGALNVRLPMLTVLASAHDASGENAIDVALPALTFEALGGATLSGELPALQFEAVATGTALITIDAALPALQFDASGTTNGAAQIVATLPVASFVGYGGAVLSVTLGAITADIEATSGAVGGLVATLPMFDVVIEAIVNGMASLDAVIPAIQSGPYLQMWTTLPMVQFVASGTATVTATYEAYALNLKHVPQPNQVVIDELTHYTNFPFQRIVRYRNSYFGVAGDGLYLLQGTTDYDPGAPTTPKPISWAWKTAITDFKETRSKSVICAYYGGRMSPGATLTAYAGEGPANAYSYSTPRGSTAQNHRQLFGKGIRAPGSNQGARYWAFGGAGSGELDLPSIEFNIATLARRV